MLRHSTTLVFLRALAPNTHTSLKWYSSCDDCMHLYGSICKLPGFLNVYSCERAMHIYIINFFLNQGRAWFLNIDPVWIVSMCVCVCVSAPKAINN